MNPIHDDPAALESQFNACMFRPMCLRHRDRYQRLLKELRHLVAADEALVGNDHSGPFGAALDPARALLRELGEE